MEEHYISSVKQTLRKERDPRVLRNVLLMKEETMEDFMSKYLRSLEQEGRGSFSARKRRSSEMYQWRCERSNKASGNSNAKPEETRANSCPAYVSFQCVEENDVRLCIVRLMAHHSGHSLFNRNENVINRIDGTLILSIHQWLSQGMSNSDILLKSVEWAQIKGETDQLNRRFFVRPDDITYIRSVFNARHRLDGNDCMAVGAYPLKVTQITHKRSAAQSVKHSKKTKYCELGGGTIKDGSQLEKSPGGEEDVFTKLKGRASETERVRRTETPEEEGCGELWGEILDIDEACEDVVTQEDRVESRDEAWWLAPEEAEERLQLTSVVAERDESNCSALPKTKSAVQQKDAKDDFSEVPGTLQEKTKGRCRTKELQAQKSTSDDQLMQKASLNQLKVSHYYVESLLTSCNFKQKKRYSVDLEEIKRRCARPECMSLNGLVSYLRKGKSQKGELKEELQAEGIVPCDSTAISSLCSKLTEGEVEDLLNDLGRLASRYVKHNHEPGKLTTSDLEEAILKSKQLRKSVSDTSIELQKCMVDFDLVTHGIGSKMIALSTKMICHFLEEQEKFLSAEHANEK